jgi:predicted amidohydrolase
MTETFPEDPADLFAHLVEWLDLDLDDLNETLGWMSDESVQDIADILEEAALNNGFISSDATADLLDVPDEEDRPKRVLSILIGLDRALLYANPYYGSFDQGALTNVAVRYIRTGVLNSDTSRGALLPRASFPGRQQVTPNTLNDVFISVAWVPRKVWRRTAHLRIPKRNDLTRLDRASVDIACVPMVDDADDLDWKVETEDGERFYRIAVREESDVPDRIPRLLSEVDLSGATIAVLPELVLNPRVMSSWLRAVAEASPPSESNLKWIFIGSGNVTGQEPPVNRCVLIDRVTVEIVFSQDKMYPFTLTTEQLSEWNLADRLGTEAAEEALVRGRQIVVAESGLGRVAILVCEDLARIMDVGPPLRGHGVSHLFSPIFSKEVRPHYWEHQKAKEYATETGALVVASNSLVIARLADPVGPWGSSIAHSPNFTRIARAERWSDISMFHILGTDPVSSFAAPEDRADDDV